MSEVKGAFVLLVILLFAMAGSGAFDKVFSMSKECENNSDCGGNRYCGSDFKCHEFPKVENTIIKNDWITPAAILGLAIVVAAFILRKRQPELKYYR